MKVQVKLFASLRIDRFVIKEFDVEKNTSCHKLFNLINLEDEDISILLINGIHSKTTDLLKNNDIISLFPPTGGG